MNYNKMYLPDIVGKGYGEFWRFKGRYRVVKGSRASKKSYTTALWYIYNMMKIPDTNLLVVRKVSDTNRSSTHKQLITAIKRLKVDHLWEYSEKPSGALDITYKPTGQRILFKGLDNPTKVTSTTVSSGYLCWVWFVEAYEVLNEDDFDKVDMSIRGTMPNHVFKQITLTFNPWNDKHWMNKRFFWDNDKPIKADIGVLESEGKFIHKHTDDTFVMTTNHKLNEFLDTEDKRLFNEMKKRSNKKYMVAGLGMWGIAEGLIFENWQERLFDWTLLRKNSNIEMKVGLDFGYTNDPTAIVPYLINQKDKTIYIFDEIYEKGLSNESIYSKHTQKEWSREKVFADQAEPKSIARLKSLGMRVSPCIKGKDSINSGIDFLQGFTIFIHPKCVNVLTEFSNYTWEEDKTGKKLNKPVDDFNHAMDAIRYAVSDIYMSRVGLNGGLISY